MHYLYQYKPLVFDIIYFEHLNKNPNHGANVHHLCNQDEFSEKNLNISRLDEVLRSFCFSP